MFLLFFLCWVIFNQAFTPEIALFGVVISAAVYLFVCRFMGYSVKKDLFIVKKIPLIISYVFILLFEVVRANVTLVRLYIRKGKNREPVLVTFRTSLKKGISKALLANAITLTPGTITISLEKDKLTVHCFDASLAEGLNNTVFEKHLARLEGGWDA